jgi:hypothetical protein
MYSSSAAGIDTAASLLRRRPGLDIAIIEQAPTSQPAVPACDFKESTSRGKRA